MAPSGQATTGTAESGGEIILEARNVVRKYPGTTALKGVTFRVYRNRVNVLIGENGAGKSTLMRLLAGAEQATSGELILEGKPVEFADTRVAARHGIAMVYQELSVLPNLSIADNVFAGRELRNGAGVVRDGEQRARSTDALKRLGSVVDTRTLAGLLPLGQQQIVEIARCLAHRSGILILDEPTSALGGAECERLFSVIGELKQQGVSIVYISHRLQELMELGDHFTVLRDGLVAGECDRAAVSRRWIVERMTGRTAQAAAVLPVRSVGDVLLRTRALTVVGRDGRRVLDEVSVSAAPGEIVGVYGLLGSGRTELLETLAGARMGHTGEIFLRGRVCRFASAADAMRQGVALVPEDRKRDALVPDLSIRENISLAAVQRFGRWFVSRRREAERVRQLADDLRIRAEDLERPVSSLSGGNQQKVVLARCLMCEPALLLLDEPTRGVDVGAKAEIYQILAELAAKGMCILFTSSEMEEVQQLAHRVAVLSRGAVVDEFDVQAASEDRIFSAASGSRMAERDHA
jgi:erythritol transport system ATP-binding protein